MKMKKICLFFATLFLSATTCVAININKENATPVEAIGADAYWSTVDSKANAQTIFNKLAALTDPYKTIGLRWTLGSISTNRPSSWHNKNLGHVRWFSI